MHVEVAETPAFNGREKLFGWDRSGGDLLLTVQRAALMVMLSAAPFCAMCVLQTHAALC